MSNQNLNSENIDDYRNFNFARLGDAELTISEQTVGWFPLTKIVSKDGHLNIEVYYEIYPWDYWIRHHSVKKFERAFYDSFKTVKIESVIRVEVGVFDEIDEKILLTWNLKMSERQSFEDIKAAIINSVDRVLFETRISLIDTKSVNGFKKYFLVGQNSMTIGIGTFWLAMPIVCGVSYFLGTVKFDSDKIRLHEENRLLSDSIKMNKSTIKYLRKNSDSALNILGHMPYDQMRLDTASFRKVQTNIEQAGAALYLNK